MLCSRRMGPADGRRRRAARFAELARRHAGPVRAVAARGLRYAATSCHPAGGGMAPVIVVDVGRRHAAAPRTMALAAHAGRRSGPRPAGPRCERRGARHGLRRARTGHRRRGWSLEWERRFGFRPSGSDTPLPDHDAVLAEVFGRGRVIRRLRPASAGQRGHARPSRRHRVPSAATRAGRFSGLPARSPTSRLWTRRPRGTAASRSRRAATRSSGAFRSS